MSDFLSNLLLRSNAPTSGAVLQPRLPSLFESPHGAEQLSVPVADVVTRDALAAEIPASYPVEQTAKQDETLPGKPAIESIQPAEHRQTIPTIESNTVMTWAEKGLNATQEESPVRMDPRSSRTVLLEKQAEPVFDASPASIRKKPPLQDGSPFDPQETTLGARPAVEAGEGPPSQEDGDKPQREPRLFNEKQAVRAVAQRHPAGNIPQPPVHPTVSASANKPVFTPLTVEPPVHKNGVQPEIPARNETVVQVRIGRIEVRAVNPPASLPRPADRVVPEKPKMSLEDYLRQREKKQ
jgi:hypothetical protein